MMYTISVTVLLIALMIYDGIYRKDVQEILEIQNEKIELLNRKIKLLEQLIKEQK